MMLNLIFSSYESQEDFSWNYYENPEYQNNLIRSNSIPNYEDYEEISYYENEYPSLCPPACLPECPPICPPIYKPYHRTRCIPECPPICKPYCPPICIPECPPICKPNHHSRCIPECKPVCKPKSKKKHKHKKEHCIVKRSIDHEIKLIQQVLYQGICEVNKLSKFFADDLKSQLQDGLILLIKSAQEKLFSDLSRFEQRILDIVIRYNKNILREIEAVITQTNEEVLETILSTLTLSNRTLDTNLTALGADVTTTPITVELADVQALVATSFADLLTILTNLFRRANLIELNAIRKAIIENKNLILTELTKAIEEFICKLTRHFCDLTDEECKLIRRIIDQSARRLLMELENIIYQIGNNIIIILKGSNEQCGSQMGGINTICWDTIESSENIY